MFNFSKGFPASIPSLCNGTTTIPFESIKELLSPSLFQAIESMGYQYMTEIQRRVFDLLLSYDDQPSIKAIAKTGSGKTLAYLLPLVHMVTSLNVRDSAGAYF